jgi:hypothetical protein
VEWSRFNRCCWLPLGAAASCQHNSSSEQHNILTKTEAVRRDERRRWWNDSCVALKLWVFTDRAVAVGSAEGEIWEVVQMERRPPI